MRSRTARVLKPLFRTLAMMWLKNLLLELGFKHHGLMLMFCDNQFAIYIAHNHLFHKRTKHIEVDCHLVRDAWTKKVISLLSTPYSKQLAGLLTKAALSKVFSILCSKLGMIDSILQLEGVLDKLLGYWASTQSPYPSLVLCVCVCVLWFLSALLKIN